MRTFVISLVTILIVLELVGLRNNAPLPLAAAAKPAPIVTATVDFDRQVKPLLQSKCMPCHFSGGKVYDRLPFDQPATIRKLGTKLFTRIKDEADRQLIKQFLDQSP